MARTHALNVIRLMGEDARPLLSTIKEMPDEAGPQDYDIRARNAVVLKLEK